MNQVRTLSHDNSLILYIHLLCMIFCTFFLYQNGYCRIL
jgi:hypothetical protein